MVRIDRLGWREVGDEVIVLDLDSSKYLRLNQSGAIMWPHLVSGTTLEELISLLVETFDVPTDRARQDAGAFVAMCLERGIIEEKEARN
jgi:hypothetical protein